MPRLVGDRLGLFEFADQRVLFGARFQRRQRRRMQAMGEQREIAFGGEREQRQHVIVEGAAQHEIERDRRRDRRGRRQRRDRQVAASMLDTAITSSIRNIISVFETTSRPAGWIRIAVQHRP